MDIAEAGSSQETIGSVKQAVNFYGGKQDRRRTQMSFSEFQLKRPSSRARELHMAKKDISELNENKRLAECMRSEAESELIIAKRTVKDLTFRIEESRLNARQHKLELGRLKRPERRNDERAFIMEDRDNQQYTDLVKELESVKRELSKLKLDMAHLLETKSQMDRETEASTSRMRSYSSSIEGLKKEIEEANEEQVLAELARIEALKETEAIKAQREAEASEFATTLENTRKKMKDIIHDMDHSKELESKLAVTISDVNVLQNELQLVKAMGESFKRKETSKEAGEGELEAAKKELASIKEEGFQFMASMDIIRNELQHVSEENIRLKSLERKSEATVKNLNLKLLKAKSKLESVTLAEENAKGIASSLSATLEQLTTEAEAAKKEKELISETTATIRKETEKIESEIDLAEERLNVAAKELEEAKASEAFALESLKLLSEKTMTDRASASQRSSTITITNFEYKYLTGCAEGVEEIADKKVAAAQAWIEALKASEKEILMKTEISLREMRELKLVEEEQAGESRQQHERPRKSVRLQVDETLGRKSIKDYNQSLALRKPTPRWPSSPGGRRVSRSGSITLKKRPKVVPNLGKLFGSKEP